MAVNAGGAGLETVELDSQRDTETARPEYGRDHGVRRKWEVPLESPPGQPAVVLEAIGTAEWTGTPLKGILDEAGVSGAAAEIIFSGFDGGVQGDDVQVYQRSLTIEEASREEMLLAYEMTGQPLQPQHGYPFRLIVPGWYGMASVKWLDRMEAVGEPFQGHQMTKSYRYTQDKDDPGDPVS